ncbi:MAG: hypothetical protein WBH22_27240 [Pseudomonas mandelii]|uniref:hypothetical protein n=1 Tax=Pseudomonas mandelii TaxID=75612 RepID=UPI003C737BD7
MHRIDGPGATVDNRFTDGDPVGGIQATMVTDDWANDVQEELMSVLAAAGIAPVKGTQDQLLKSIRKMSSGVPGTAINLKMASTGTNAIVSINADFICVANSAGDQKTLSAVVIGSLNLATSGVNGLDTGAMATNTWYATYVIWNPTTGVVAGLASLSYTNPTMPAGFTHRAFVESVRVGATVTRIWPFRKRGRDVMYAPDPATDLAADFPNAVSGGTATSSTPVSLVGLVPPNATSALMGLNSSGSVSSIAAVYAVPSGGVNRGLLAQAITNGSSTTRTPFEVVDPFIYGINYAVTGTATATITVCGWRS